MLSEVESLSCCSFEKNESIHPLFIYIRVVGSCLNSSREGSTGIDHAEGERIPTTPLRRMRRHFESRLTVDASQKQVRLNCNFICLVMLHRVKLLPLRSSQCRREGPIRLNSHLHNYLTLLLRLPGTIVEDKVAVKINACFGRN